jgi:tRNA (uracil-5-)-methyltransferase TRM9
MTEATVQKLNNVNKAFYDSVAQYFDNSRQYSWEGWEIIFNLQSTIFNYQTDRVLDVGCGNGRFYEFLEGKEFQGEYVGIDSNAFLLARAEQKGSQPLMKVVNADVLGNWSVEEKYDLIVVFGVMHHIPSFTRRLELIKKLEQYLAPNGTLVLSFWNFMDDERIARKVADWKEIDLQPDEVEKDDYLLSWDRGTRALRYCHYFSEEEITTYVHESGLKEISRFKAEGKDKNLNTYLVLQKD